MSSCLLGPGLVGCFLGALGGFSQVIPGPSGQLACTKVRLGALRTPWQPQRVATPTGPCLVCCRSPDTPPHLPAQSLLAQNGLGHQLPVISCFVACDIDAEGWLHAADDRCLLRLATPHPCWQPVLSAWRQAGIVVDLLSPAQAVAAQWEKAILNATVGPLCLVHQRSMATVWNDPQLHRLVHLATAEGEAIARAEGIVLDPGLWQRASDFFARVGSTHVPSVLRDPRELDHLFGPLLSAAQRHQLACPTLQHIAEACAQLRSP